MMYPSNWNKLMIEVTKQSTSIEMKLGDRFIELAFNHYPPPNFGGTKSSASPLVVWFKLFVGKALERSKLYCYYLHNEYGKWAIKYPSN